MKRFLIIFTLAIAFTLLKVIYQAGYFKVVENKFEGEVTRIYNNVNGPEDMQMDHENGNLYISSTNRSIESYDPNNGIYLLNINNSGIPSRLPTDFEGELNPYGISLLKKDGNIYLFVVNYNSDGKFIEVFTHQDNSLKHIRSYTTDRMCCPNDVVATDVDKFYVTNDHGSKSNFNQFIEDYIRIPMSSIYYYDGNQFIKEAAPFHSANGIAVSPDGKTLYLTMAIGNSLNIFNIDEDGSLIEVDALDLDSGVDNIDIDEEGNLWIAAHPKLFHYVKHSKGIGDHSPSEVFKLVQDGKTFKPELVYSNDGTELSGSSVAVYHRGEIFIGTVYEPTILRASIK